MAVVNPVYVKLMKDSYIELEKYIEQSYIDLILLKRCERRRNYLDIFP